MAFIGFFETFLAITCFLVFAFICKRKFLLPLVGALPDLIFNIHRIHDFSFDILQNSNMTCFLKGPKFANMDFLVTAFPSNIHYIMSSNFSNFPKGHEFKKIFDFLGDGIFNSDFDLWKTQRRSAHAFMNNKNFYEFLVKTSQNKVDQGLVSVLNHVCQEGLVLDLQDLFQRFTFDTTCILVTGYDPCSLSNDFPENEFAKALDDAEEAIFYRHLRPETFWKLQSWFRVGQENKMRNARRILDRVVAKYVSLKRLDMSESTRTIDKSDLLASYLKSSDTFDDKFLKDIILNFMLAGRDTTSSALSWFFWLVSTNPIILSKIRQEIKSKIPKTESPRLFDIKEVNNLVYLHGALCETLRLYPPVPFQHKSPLKPDILPSGHRVDTQTKIMFSLYAMGRMCSLWGDDCREFKPERWITDKGGVKHEPSYKFLAFNAGPRTCLGKEVAFTQMKLVAAAVLHNYDFDVVEGQIARPSLSIMLHMKDSFRVKVTKRLLY